MKMRNVYQKNTIIAIYNGNEKCFYQKNTIIAIYNENDKCLLEKYNNCNLQ